MAVELNLRCDGCGRHFSEGDEVYCVDCYNAVLDHVRELEEENEALRREIEELMSGWH